VLFHTRRPPRRQRGRGAAAASEGGGAREAHRGRQHRGRIARARAGRATRARGVLRVHALGSCAAFAALRRARGTAAPRGAEPAPRAGRVPAETCGGDARGGKRTAQRGDGVSIAPARVRSAAMARDHPRGAGATGKQARGWKGRRAQPPIFRSAAQRRRLGPLAGARRADSGWS